MKAALRWIASNLTSMLMASALAVLAWIVAVAEVDPTVERRYAQDIPITLSDLPAEMMIVGEFDESARFTVRAPESVFNSLRTEDFTATISVAGLDAGAYQVPVEWSLNRQPARVVLVEPDQVAVELVPQAERIVPVRLEPKGEPTLGYVMETALITPSQVTVNGPSTYVTRVVEAVVQVPVREATTDVEGDYPLLPYDEGGQFVPYVTLTSQRANVHIPIKLSVYYRPLVIKVTLEGQVAPGYRIAEKISVDPTSITVFGLPSVIDVLPGYIETEPINLEGAQADIVERPQLKVPPNVSVVIDEQPVVRIPVVPIESSQTVEIVPQLQGLEPGLTATVSPETVEVLLSGSLPLLEALETDDVRVVLDLYGLVLGTHQVEPDIVVPEGVSAQSVLPATVQVGIFVMPTSLPAESQTDLTIVPTTGLTTEMGIEPTVVPTIELTVEPTSES